MCAEEDNKQLQSGEYEALIEELHELKNCQVRFLTFSVTATGLIIGAGAGFATIQSNYACIFFLAPLVILLPSWYIFFDKAGTISRIVGYKRLLEKLLRGHPIRKDIHWCGWENALGLFRQFNNKYVGKVLEKGKYPRGLRKLQIRLKMLFLATAHRYWMLAYHSFMFVSFACLGLSGAYLFVKDLPGSAWPWALLVVWACGLVLCLIATVWNFWLVTELTIGTYSYNFNYLLWTFLLNKKNLEELKGQGFLEDLP